MAISQRETLWSTEEQLYVQNHIQLLHSRPWVHTQGYLNPSFLHCIVDRPPPGAGAHGFLQPSHLEASGRSPTSVREESGQCEDTCANMQWKVSSVGSEREWTQDIFFKTE